MKRILIILILGLMFIGCGENSSQKDNVNVSYNLPTVSLVDKEQNTKQQKATQVEIDMIKNSVHELPWAYYQEERSTTDKRYRRWFISNLSLPYVFSLMKIENGKAGWGEVSATAGSINLNSNSISVGDIPTRNSCSYYDRGLNKERENCIIKSDVTNIRNSIVPILWWFFQASNGSWYIMQEGNSVAYKFSGDANGQYDWSHTVDIGIKPTFFVENGVKKMKF